VTVARPIFSDGAILAAADLSSLETEGRGRDARHARHLHTPGVGAGLELHEQPQTVPGTGAPYVELTLGAGYALDGTGRELVVGADLPLSPDRFQEQNLNPPTLPGQTVTVWHPVFVRGVDTTVDATTAALGCQGRSGGGRVAEEVEIEFGRPGDATVAQSVPPPDAGAGDGTWRVLVGFVQFDTAIGQFVKKASSADGVSVAGAGARAGLVAGQFGRVELRAKAAADSGVPAVVLDTEPGPSLVFGTHTGTGTVAPLFSVDASGNLEVQGAVKAKGTAGTVQIAGGIASDGTVLPLPPGVDQATVDSGGVELFITVTPRLPLTGPSGGVVFTPVECRVDGDRRVVCWGLWIGPAFGDRVATAISCDYVMLAAVPGGP
jgi:hypothetical protein